MMNATNKSVWVLGYDYKGKFSFLKSGFLLDKCAHRRHLY